MGKGPFGHGIYRGKKLNHGCLEGLRVCGVDAFRIMKCKVPFMEVWCT